MQTSLYDLLGIDRDASTAAIKAAFHWKRRGGDAAATPQAGDPEKLKLAYEVLSDAESRRHYDATGEIPPRPTMPFPQGELDALIAELFAKAIAESESPQFDNVVKRMRAIATQNLQVCHAQVRKLDSTAEKLAITADRIQTTDESNLLRSLVTAWQGDLPRMAGEVKRVCRLYEDLLRFLESYSYRVDELADDII